MKLIIDIPEEVYERFGYEYTEENIISIHTNDIILDAFCNCTPLDGVLQEIRQEIDSHGIIMQISNGEKIIGENVYIAKEIALEIIDKHIGGTE